MEDGEAQQEAGQEPEKPKLSVISAAELQEMDLPPVKFVVEKLLLNGLSMLAAPSKYGKSWMVLDICLSVASGSRFLGYTTNKSGCLYLALEDSQNRLKARMNKVLAGRPAPKGFYYATMAHSIDEGLLDELDGFLKEFPNTGLVVVDTLQKVRGVGRGRESAYAGDYREMAQLKSFADGHGIALLLVHHLRKMQDDGDPFNRISGTTGLMGASDTTLVPTKEKRNSDSATLNVTGRDVETSETVIRFDKDSCRWENLGDAEAYAEAQARKEYEDSPITQTIKTLLNQSGGEWTGTSKQLMEAGRYIARATLAPSERALSDKLKAMDTTMFEIDGIIHERKKNGSGGGAHVFRYDIPFEE